VTSPPFLFELLGSQHKKERAAFSCGVESLDKYFHEQVSQDVRRRVTACYVALEAATRAIAGYYTLAAGGVLLTDMPEATIKRLPRYPTVPVARVGRLAVALDFRARKLGAAMLYDAALRASRSEVAVFGLVVDAKGDQAVTFCEHHGFVALGSGSRQLVLSLKNIGAGG
jgi:GNAT superfamily N-acetyltransferase